MKKLFLTILFTMVLSVGASADTTNDKIKLDVTFCHSKNSKPMIATITVWANITGEQQKFNCNYKKEAKFEEILNYKNLFICVSDNKTTSGYFLGGVQSKRCTKKYSEKSIIHEGNSFYFVNKQTATAQKKITTKAKPETNENEVKLIEDKKELNEVKKKEELPNRIILLIEREDLVNKENIADIKFKSNENVERISLFSQEQLASFKKDYGEAYFIIKKDFIVNSSPGSTKKIQSSYMSGTRSKPNPEYKKVNLTIRKLNNFINSATQEYYQKQQIASQNCESFCNNPANTGPCWQCSLAKTGAALRIGVLQNEINEAQNIISELQDQLLNIDQIIYEDVFSPYQYTLNKIDGVKESIYEVFLFKDKKFYKSNIKIKEKKIFQLPSNVSENDKDPQLFSKYDTLDDVKNWEITQMKKVNSSELFDEINKNIIEIEEDKFYVYFNINPQIEEDKKEDSFLSKIFSGNNENNKNSEKDKTIKIDSRFKSVVIIETLNSMGSGFFVEPNKIITNFHVVDGAKRITIKNFDGKRSSAKILKIDTRRDLALLETNFKGDSVKFYDSEIYPGLEVEAIGHPNGLDYSLTKGVVSNIRKYSSTYNVTQNANTKFIQTDVAINPGNSGGPLFHKEFVIGVNTQGLTKSKFEGLNFSVHLDELIDFLS